MSQSAFLAHATGTYYLEGKEWIVGRQQPADLVLPYQQISRRHARLDPRPEGYFLSDLGSRFGTFVNGRVVGEDGVRLCDGDEVVLGGVLALRYEDPGETRGGRKVGRLNGVWLDGDADQVFVDAELVEPPLSAAQSVLLRLLVSQEGTFVSREQVVAEVWPDQAADGISEEAVDGLIKRLRARLREHGRPDYLEVRRGRGLRLLKPQATGTRPSG